MAEILQTPLTVMHVLSCVFLILVILIQPGKSGGGGIFGSAGAQAIKLSASASTTTWATATLFFTTSMTLAYLSSSSDEALQKKAAHMSGGMSKGLGKPIKLPRK